MSTEEVIPETPPQQATAVAEEEKKAVDGAEEQKVKWTELMKQRMKEGEQWFLLSAHWYRLWRNYTGYQDTSAYSTYSWDNHYTSTSSTTTPSSPGPIDNSDLVDADPLDPEAWLVKRNLLENTDYELIPQPAWDYLVAIYGGGPAVGRRVIRSGSYYGGAGSLQVDLRPNTIVGHKSSAPDATVTVRMSKTQTLKELKDELCKRLEIAADSCRVWDFHGNARFKLLDDETKTLEVLQIIDNNPILLEEKQADGAWPPAPERPSYTSTYNSSSPVTTTYNSAYSGGWSSSYYQAPPMESPGLCGLHNMGNTCFMNSALQCLSNSQPLVDYLLSPKWREELNKTNPLGTKGELTTEYAALVRTLWKGQSSSCTPRDFKCKLERFASQFAGYQQHDSQELLAFLLDGLHEDLNRVKDKPYVPTPDYNSQPDEQWAAEAWQRHLARNNSVIVDLFQGQLKSTVVCPVCGTKSITFDPFMYLSVPLPQTKVARKMTVTVHYRDPAVPAKRLDGVVVPDPGTVGQFIQNIAEKAGIVLSEENSCVLTELYSSKIFKVWKNDESTELVNDRDILHAYEVNPQQALCKMTMIKEEKTMYSMQYVTETPFGVPVLLSVREDATYEELCLQVLQYYKTTLNTDRMLTLIQQSESPEHQPQEQASTTCEVVEMKTETDRGDDESSSSTDSYDSNESSPPPPEQQQEDASLVEEAEDNFMSAPTTTATTMAKPKPLHAPPPVPRKACQIEGEFIAGQLSNAKLLNFVDDLFEIGLADDWARSLPYAARLAVGPRDKPLKLNGKGALNNFVVKWVPEADAVYRPMLLGDASTTYGGNYGLGSMREPEQPVDLEKCMELYMSEEKLSPEDLWHCPKCKEFRQATKKFDLWKLPPLLVVHLKRFSYKSRWSYRDKLDTLVNFPVEGMDLTRRVLGPHGHELIYDLYAVSNHYGGMGGGHYTAFAKNKITHEWHKFDDSSVSKVGDPESVKTTAAYMLFYQLRGWSGEQQTEEPNEAANEAIKALRESAVSSMGPDPSTSSAVSTSRWSSLHNDDNWYNSDI